MNDHKKLTTWHEAYREVAVRLYAFQLKRLTENGSAAQELFRLLNNSEFSKKNKWFTRGIEKWDNKSMDPIQIFASFSHSKSKNSSRIENINIILERLGSSKRIEDAGEDFFVGCPTVMMSRPITTRAPEFQDQIWAVFNRVTNIGLGGLTEESFYQYQFWYGINIVSFSIFLFWVNSDVFVPLDSSTRAYLQGIGKWEEVPYEFNAYMSFCRSIGELEDKNVVRDIVKIAYQTRIEKGTIEYRPITSQFLGIEEKEKRDEKIGRILHPFRIIAIKPTEKGGNNKNLHPEIYRFYNQYTFVGGEDAVINCIDEESTRDLYQGEGSEETDVQISAMVGKNGSGKSTISELIYMAINAISLKNEKVSEELVGEKVFLEMYFFTNELYKLSISGDQVQLNKYDYKLVDDIEQFTLTDNDLVDTFDFSSLFYTIGVNYSLFGLNVNHTNGWIDPLFHKNDSYQVPVVLNPKRNEGTIDVNVEESLSKVRLLSHVLEVDRFDETDYGQLLVPELVKGKRPKNLVVSLDTEKFSRLNQKYKEYKIYHHLVLDNDSVGLSVESVFELFWKRIGNPEIAEGSLEAVKDYCVFKLFAIGETYKRYRQFIYVNNKTGTIEFFGDDLPFFDEVLKDTSHVTFKLWQAIHYLIYGHISIDSFRRHFISIEELAQDISRLRAKASEDEFNKKNFPNRSFDTVLFIPPSIFKVDIQFESDYLFSGLSSGEKQSIFAINTVAYHLFNLNSIDTSSDLQTYPYVNILFDEVELCFHPNMQRRFVHDLLHFMQYLDLPNILSVHFQFITHSPFILSDIPNTNILRLTIDENTGLATADQGSQPTFGANIHKLLADSFFMSEGFLGEFARRKIQDVLYYLRDKKDQMYKEQEMSEKEVWNIIQLIGEPFIKNKMTDLFFEKYGDNRHLDSEIEKAQRRLEDLQNKKNGKE